MDTLFPEYEEHKDILRIGQYALVKYGNPIKKEKKRGITNERQAVLKEIADTIKAESGAVNVKLLAIKLAHIPTPDLYFMLSEGKDYRNRTGKPFGKYIYGSIKVK